MDRNQPVDTLRDGALKATVWENQSDKGETYFSVTLAKTYEDRNGALQDGHSFTQNDLLRVAELAREAHALTRDLRRERVQEQKQDRGQQPDREGRQSGFRRGSKNPQPGMER